VQKEKGISTRSTFDQQRDVPGSECSIYVC
jgi:hypothetical protein